MAYFRGPGVRSRSTSGISTPSTSCSGRRTKVSQVRFVLSVFEAIAPPRFENLLAECLGIDAVKGGLDRDLPLPRPLRRPGAVEGHRGPPLGAALLLAVAGGEGVGPPLVVDHVDSPRGVARGGEGGEDRPHVEWA